MNNTQFAMLVLSGLCLVNLAVCLRVAQRLRAQDVTRENFGRRSGSALAVGVTAPPFRALSLTGLEITEARLAGRSVALVFVSPSCGTCRTALAGINTVATLAKQAAGVDIVVVSDSGVAKTRAWLDTLRYEDDLTITQPVLAAPLSQSPMLADLNPHSRFPSFCLLDADRVVRGYGGVGAPEWTALLASWHGVQVG